MKQRRSHILALLAPIIAVLTNVPPANADGQVIVAAQETAAIVEPRAASLKLVNLPALEFALRAAIRCKGDAISLTLSVADTFKTLGRDELAGKRAAEATLTVPARQLALAASSRFCIDEDEEAVDELLVPGLATVHASLQCARDGAMSAHFASAPLQVRLNCARRPEEPQVSPEPPAAR